MKCRPGIDVMIEGVVVRMNEERRRCGCDADAEFLHRSTTPNIFLAGNPSISAGKVPLGTLISLLRRRLPHPNTSLLNNY
jgi:hypothetical protein